MKRGYWDFKSRSWITIKQKGKSQAVPVTLRNRRRGTRTASVVDPLSGYTPEELKQGVHLGGIRLNGVYYEIVSGNPSRESMGRAPIAVWSFDSSSNPNGKPYETRLNDNNRLSCNCKGWTRRVDSHGLRSCKHTKKVISVNQNN